MQRYIYILLLVMLVSVAAAQTEKGRYIVGGNVDISGSIQGDVKRFNMTLAPSFGIFVVKGFAIGGRYSFGVSSISQYDEKEKERISTVTFSTAIGPLVKGYFGPKRLKGFATANVQYLTSTTLRKSRINGTQGLSTMGSVGIAHFFNNNVVLESGLYVSLQSVVKQLPITRIGFSMGLFVILDKKKKE